MLTIFVYIDVYCDAESLSDNTSGYAWIISNNIFILEDMEINGLEISRLVQSMVNVNYFVTMVINIGWIFTKNVRGRESDGRVGVWEKFE